MEFKSNYKVDLLKFMKVADDRFTECFHFEDI